MEQGHRCELIFNIDDVGYIEGDVDGYIEGVVDGYIEGDVDGYIDVDLIIHRNGPCPLLLMSSTGCCHEAAEY